MSCGAPRRAFTHLIVRSAMSVQMVNGSEPGKGGLALLCTHMHPLPSPATCARKARKRPAQAGSRRQRSKVLWMAVDTADGHVHREACPDTLASRRPERALPHGWAQAKQTHGLPSPWLLAPPPRETGTALAASSRLNPVSWRSAPCRCRARHCQVAMGVLYTVGALRLVPPWQKSLGPAIGSAGARCSEGRRAEPCRW